VPHDWGMSTTPSSAGGQSDGQKQPTEELGTCVAVGEESARSKKKEKTAQNDVSTQVAEAAAPEIQPQPEKRIRVNPRHDDLLFFEEWFTKHEPPRGEGQQIQIEEGWLRHLTHPASTLSQQKTGHDKCIELARREGLQIFTCREPEQAAKHLREHGVAVMCNVLSDAVLDSVQKYYAETIRIAVRCNPKGNRGHHRYSLGMPPMVLGLPLVAQPAVIDTLRHYFGNDDVSLEDLSGDFSLPSAEAQHMHIDFPAGCGKHDRNEHMANVIKVYYTMMDHDDITGPTRFVMGSHRRSVRGEKVKEEKSILAYAPRGSAVIMDLRVWHGGTANKSPFARPMIGAHYQGPHTQERPIQKGLDRARFDQLTELEQKVCRNVVKDL